MARRTKDEAQETRNTILDTAERVFSERGVSRTSLADIAEAAGVTRGAIYWHFRDKADLFCEMVARVTLPMETAPCQVNHGAAADPLGSIRTMMVAILSRISEDPQARRVFHIVFHKCEYVDEMKPVWKRLSDMQVGCLKNIEQGLWAAVARGQVPKTLNTRHAALGLHALLDGLMSKWVTDPDYRPLEREAERVVDFFLGGLAGQLPARQPAPPRPRVARRRATR
ncbi:MAG: TetR family transcriptional regulator [Betaproteobacteria bacterium]|nr:TetR family transcriptional regulator [Betaproteobacteria bacterium]